MIKKKITIITLISLILLSGCHQKNPVQSDAIILEETLNSEDSTSASNESSNSYILEEKEPINTGEITNESSSYADIENLMNKIAKETGGFAINEK